MTAGISPQCYLCVHLLPPVPRLGWCCAAFERGIPKAILVNAADHREPYEGDGGVRFEARAVADAGFKEDEHPRDEDGKFSIAAVSSALKESVLELKYFKYREPRPERRVSLKRGGSYVAAADPHHWVLASTEQNTLGNPVTVPGHKSATGIAIKVNPQTKHIYFSELNSHHRGAGLRMVEAVIRAHPNYTFSVTDWSQASEDVKSGPSFWDKVKHEHPDRFIDDSANCRVDDSTDDLVGPLHPGVEVALRRLDMDEYQISQAIAAGELTSPQRFENSWFFAIRITGTGAAYRDALGEHVWRKPEEYLTPYFLERAKGLPVIWEHPPGLSLDTDEYRERNIGAVNGVTWIPEDRPDEVWGIARVIDGEGAQYMIDHPEISTSPAVVFRDGSGNEVVGMEDGKHLLVEGHAKLLDHVAICQLGTWDKAGPPTGVDIVTDGEVRMDDDKTRKDAAEEKLDKILEGLGSVADAVKKHADRMDAFERRMDARDDDDRKRDDARRRDDDYRKRDDEDPAQEERQAAELERLAAEEKEEAKGDSRHRDDDDDRRRDDESCEEHSERMDAKGKKSKLPAFMKRDDESCEEHSERVDRMARDDDRKRDDRKRDDRRKRDDDRKRDDRRARDDKKRDDGEEEPDGHEGEGEPRAAESTNDKKRDDDRKRDDDDDRARKDSVDIAALKRRLREQDGRIEEQDKLLRQVANGRSEGDAATMASIQERADSVFFAHNERAPAPLAAETEVGYRLRLARKLQPHSKTWRDADLAVLAKHAPKAFENAEATIYADAAAASHDVSGLPEDVLVEYKVPRDGMPGMHITQFRGRSPLPWMETFSAPRRRFVRINPRQQ